MLRAFAAAVLCLCGAAVPCGSRQVPGRPIRADVRAVLIPVTVTDSRGRFVSGLRAADFTVTDGGRTVRHELDTAETFTPISLAIGIQTSDVAAAVLAKVRKAGSLIQPLVTGERGEAAILTFDEKVRLAQDFTNDPGRIVAAFQSLQPSSARTGRTVDALAEAVRRLSLRPAHHRKVVLLVAESRDRGSEAGLWDTLAIAQKEGILAYPLTFSPHKSAWTAKAGEVPPPADGLNLIAVFQELGRLGKKDTAEAIAHATGGQRLSFATLRGFERAVSRFGEELHSQYLVSFAPADGADGYRAVGVSIPGRPELSVRARPGYWQTSASDVLPH